LDDLQIESDFEFKLKGLVPKQVKQMESELVAILQGIHLEQQQYVQTNLGHVREFCATYKLPNSINDIEVA